jgi:hypothetical protein
MKAAGVLEYQLVVTNRVEGDALSGDRLILRVGLDLGVEGTTGTPNPCATPYSTAPRSAPTSSWPPTSTPSTTRSGR